MANYVIEGTVTEITSTKNECIFKIAGTDGYAIKQGDKNYNILCPEEMPKKEKYFTSFIFSQDIHFIINNNNDALLVAYTNSKKVKLLVKTRIAKANETDENNNSETRKCIKVSSLALISD